MFVFVSEVDLGTDQSHVELVVDPERAGNEISYETKKNTVGTANMGSNLSNCKIYEAISCQSQVEWKKMSSWNKYKF